MTVTDWEIFSLRRKPGEPRPKLTQTHLIGPCKSMDALLLLAVKQCTDFSQCGSMQQVGPKEETLQGPITEVLAVVLSFSPEERHLAPCSILS